MTRKDFLTLTFTLIGATAVGAAACSDNNNTVDGGTAGTTGRGGIGGRGGSGGSGGTGGTGGSGGGGGNTAAACADPLPETQLPDATQHTHHVVIAASTLNATTAQTFTTDAIPGHSHMVTLQPADLSTIKGGGSVTVTSSSAGTPAHTHMFMVSCH